MKRLLNEPEMWARGFDAFMRGASFRFVSPCGCLNHGGTTKEELSPFPDRRFIRCSICLTAWFMPRVEVAL